ncbi:MAG: potassium transporter Kup [Thermodesulfobacteriota bacterium]
MRTCSLSGETGNQSVHLPRTRSQTASLALAALGIVYGDIGTSPLYTIKECFHGAHAVAVTPANVYGVLSMVFWSLMMVVSIKYVLFITRADNKGEGGIFALLAMLRSGPASQGRYWRMMLLMAAFGAALLYGDGVITPAISVLSAIEGLEVATEAARDFVVPLSCLVLVGLFLFQKHGTASIGRVFGPLMIVWFLVLGALGLMEIVQEPLILRALNPMHAVEFFRINHLHGIVVLGSVVLCITGGEALYADMGHFGRAPIRLSWYAVVLPGLLLNYFGQGALLLDHPGMAANPFYALVPRDLLYPMVALSTAATIIASQAMISGVYSLTQQAIQLGFTPRMHIVHTSERAVGQIYMPSVNWGLMAACIGLVLVFRESSRLAAAYGIAVTATMAITSVLYFEVTRLNWKWPLWKSAPLLALFLFFDVSFLGANLLKIVDGGWFTLTLALAVLTVMVTWRDGRAILARHYGGMRIPVDVFLRDLAGYKPQRAAGTAVFMSISPEGVPHTLLHHFKHNEALHERVVLLSILSAETPTVPDRERLAIESLGLGFYRVVASYGFMETPSVPEILELAGRQGLEFDVYATSFFLGRETLLTTGEAPMAGWRKKLFAFMSRNAWNATSFFGIPPGRVVELGNQVEL